MIGFRRVVVRYGIGTGLSLGLNFAKVSLEWKSARFKPNPPVECFLLIVRYPFNDCSKDEGHCIFNYRATAYARSCYRHLSVRLSVKRVHCDKVKAPSEKRVQL